jgi:hypothetical protein
MIDSEGRISEIYRMDSDEFLPPLDTWKIEILELGLQENLGDLGTREDFIANARVQVHESDGTVWEGLMQVDKE